MIRECCVCGKRERKGLWSRDYCPGEQVRISHGYCPVCYAEFMDRLDLLFMVRGQKKITAAAAVGS
ncbi:MAG TPA: hypothetical protein DDY20_11150 [Desulfobulbaceae bacterium]|nr:hypothetical protein [Desulfobulbaceae bacterium]